MPTHDKSTPVKSDTKGNRSADYKRAETIPGLSDLETNSSVQATLSADNRSSTLIRHYFTREPTEKDKYSAQIPGMTRAIIIDDNWVTVAIFDNRKLEMEQSNYSTESAEVAKAATGAITRAFRDFKLTAKETRKLEDLRELIGKSLATEDDIFDKKEIRRIERLANKIARNERE